MNAVAPRQRGEGWVARYGGIISSEWFFPKAAASDRRRPARVEWHADVYIEAGGMARLAAHGPISSAAPARRLQAVLAQGAKAIRRRRT